MLRHGDFTLGDEQRALREAFASFLGRECPTERVRAAEPLGFDETLWGQFVEMRAVAMGVSVAAEGDGAGLVELALVAEEVGRSLAPVPFVETAVAARLLSRCGPAGRLWSDAAVSGSQLITVALRSLRPGRSQLVPGGAVADAVVGLADDEVVVVTRPTPFEPIANHGLAPLGRLDVGDAGTTVTHIGSGPPAREAFEAAVREWQLLMPRRRSASRPGRWAQPSSSHRTGWRSGYRSPAYLGLGFHDRGRRADAAIDVIRRLWTEEVIETHDEHFDFGPVKFNPKPLQKPSIPIEVGGASKAALRRAGRIGDGWIEIGSTDFDDFESKLAVVMAARRDAGRTGPFEVTAGAGLVDGNLDGYRRLADTGVTRIMTGPPRRATPPWRVTPSDAAEWAKRFADEIIANF